MGTGCGPGIHQFGPGSAAQPEGLGVAVGVGVAVGAIGGSGVALGVTVAANGGACVAVGVAAAAIGDSGVAGGGVDSPQATTARSSARPSVNPIE